MKRGKVAETVARGIVWALAAAFLWAAVSKSMAPVATATAVAHLGRQVGMRLSGDALVLTVIVIATLEIALAVWVIGSRQLRRPAAAFCLALFLLTLVTVALALDPVAPSCGCFGGVRLAQEAAAENKLALLRNLVLLSAALWAYGRLRPAPTSPPPAP